MKSRKYFFRKSTSVGEPYGSIIAM